MKIIRCQNPLAAKAWLALLAAAMLTSLLYTTTLFNPGVTVAEDAPQIVVALKSFQDPVVVKQQKSNDLNQMIRRYHRLERRPMITKRRIRRAKADLARAILARLTIVNA